MGGRLHGTKSSRARVGQIAAIPDEGDRRCNPPPPTAPPGLRGLKAVNRQSDRAGHLRDGARTRPSHPWQRMPTLAIAWTNAALFDHHASALEHRVPMAARRQALPLTMDQVSSAPISVGQDAATAGSDPPRSSGARRP